MKTTETVAIIPARGGSKRLPRKNILPVMGRPALAYPIRAARESGLFDQIIVSTEDAQIRNIAVQYGARVMERPQKLASDRATVSEVCRDVLETLAREGLSVPWFCCIYATAVFIDAQDLKKAYTLRQVSPFADGIMGVSAYNLQPLQALTEGPDGLLNPLWKDECDRQSQSVPACVASNGSFYWLRTRAFLETGSFYVGRLKGFFIPWLRAVDMDTPEDYETVRLLAPLLIKGPQYKELSGMETCPEE